MPIRIQREGVTAAALLRWAKEWLSDRRHFTTGSLFDSGYPETAERTCALGAIRKGYCELDPDADTSFDGDPYEGVPAAVKEADHALAECLRSKSQRYAQTEVTDIHVVYGVNDSEGYEAIMQGLECATEKANV